jgi:5-methylcytosine-specific restriction protein A
MKRVCSGCGVITDKRRCPACERAHELRRARRTKGNYDSEWRRIVERAKREHPWCGVCGTPGTPGNPLTGDHVVPRAHGGRNERSNVAVLCRGCNSRKGSRLLTNP